MHFNRQCILFERQTILGEWHPSIVFRDQPCFTLILTEEWIRHMPVSVAHVVNVEQESRGIWIGVGLLWFQMVTRHFWMRARPNHFMIPWIRVFVMIKAFLSVNYLLHLICFQELIRLHPI